MILKIKAHLGQTLHFNTYILFTVRIAAAGFSFFFWALAARVITADVVGLASGTISAALLLAGLAQLGFGFALVRYLPTVKKPLKLLNGSFLVASLFGVVLAVIFLLGLEIWSPALLPLRTSWGASVILVLLVVSLVLSQLLHWAFLARRKPAFTLAKQILQLGLALILLLGLSSFLGDHLAITAAYTMATIFSLGVALLFFLPRVEPGYKFRITLPAKLRSPLTRYALTNHFADQLQRGPDALMALLVINVLGPESGAYFFVAWAIASGLFTLAASASPALLAEGANKPEMISVLAGKSLKIGLFLATTLALSTAAISRPLLAFYGNDYAKKSGGLLLLLLLSILPSAILAIYLSVLRVRDQLHSLLFLTAASTASGLLMAYYMMQGFGLIGAGFGWLLSRLLMVACLAILWKLQLGQPAPSARTSLKPIGRHLRPW
ncbi:MAG: hypothetical protein PVH03_14665 [Chloroflexota bacterium]|jgi:O-antigen/teichoic acid export membrane protein